MPSLFLLAWVMFRLRYRLGVLPSMRTAMRWAERLEPWAMAEIFIIAFTCILIKGVGVGQMEILWGTYLFSLCVIASTIVSYFSKTDT